MKKENNFIENHLFLIYWLGAALALTAGIFIICDMEKYTVTYFIIGVFLVVLGIGRLIALIKTTKTWVMRIINVLLLLADAALGVFFIWKMNDIQTTYAVLSAYLCGGLLFTNGFCSLFGSSIKHEVTTVSNFLLAVMYLGIGGYVIGSGSMNLKALNYIILVLAIIVFVSLVIVGIQNYRAYRYALKAKDSDVEEANEAAPSVEDSNESTMPNEDGTLTMTSHDRDNLK